MSSSRSRAVAKITSAPGTLARISFSTCRPSVSGRCQSSRYRSNDSRASDRCSAWPRSKEWQKGAAPSSHFRMSVAWSASFSRYAMRIGLRRGPLRAPRAELLEELLALFARRGDVALLDVPEAADLLGEGGELDCGGVILRVEAG